MLMTALRRQMLPAVPRRWTLLKAMRILGVVVESMNPNTGAPRGRGNEGLHIPRRALGGLTGTSGGWLTVSERIPGGPEYVYETARAAYRKAAWRHHPDRGGTVKAMQAVNAAMAFVERRYGPNAKVHSALA